MQVRIGNRLLFAALTLLAAASVAQAAPPATPQSPTPAQSPGAAHAPIPIHFTLSAPGYVTLVIDNAEGNRVRNLVSDTLFPAGPNTTWWDGSDDLTRTPGAADHGVYLIPPHLVSPGRYTVRGIVHSAIDLHYEMTGYGAGSPPWETPNSSGHWLAGFTPAWGSIVHSSPLVSVTGGSGGWLTNHTPGSAALFVPADRAITGSQPLIYLGSYVSEGGSSLAWVDLNGHKQGGRGWIGGDWTGAPYLARDTGSGPDHSIYTAAVWGSQKVPSPTGPMQLRITALTAHGDRSVLSYPFQGGGTRQPYDPLARTAAGHDALYIDQIAGLSVRNGVLAVSLAMRNELVLVNAVAGKVIGILQLEDPRGSVFDAQGNLYILSGKRLLRYHPQAGGVSPGMSPQTLGAPETVINSGLEDPVGITLDSESAGASIYIADRGASNQVKVFTSQGKLEHTIGHSSPLALGPYDPSHMNNPRGLAIDSNHHLWVAEEDFQPKRISEWSLDGKLVNSFLGPPEYGGGGELDPTDKTKFYYHQMEFHLDWATGQSTVASILYRPRPSDLQPPPRAGNPTDVLYSNGHRYFTNSYEAQETFGATTGMLYLDEGGILHPVAALGHASDWPVLADAAFRSKLPPGADLAKAAANRTILFTWSDLNGNGKVDPEEVSFTNSTTDFITIEAGKDGPEMLDSYVDGKAMRFTPVRLLPNGTPVYDLTRGTVLHDGTQIQPGDGDGQILASAQATVLTTAPKPYPADSLGGFDAKGHTWSYPSLWPGLHPSHSAPVADRPGELIGTTHLLGGFIPAPAPGIGDLWAINGNLGPIYLFTADGLFVAQLFQDVRTGKTWNMPQATPNMLLNDVSPHDENFFPSLNETTDGKVYLVDGYRSSLVRVDGLNTLKRLPDIPLEINPSELNTAQSFLGASAAVRAASMAPQTLQITLRPGSAPSLANLPSILSAAKWAAIDRPGTNPKPASAAVTIAAGHLYALYRTEDPNLLQNAGSMPNAAFKTGGALDLMIGTDPTANPNRENPVAGDLRLLIYQVPGSNGVQTRATLYRPVVKGTTNPIPFSSPSRTITIDQVQDVSSQIQLTASNGIYAIAVPLTTLGLNPHSGESIKADIGILRGNGQQTTQRVYWSNKATGITSDVPSEAALTPNLWGTWTFETAP